MRAGVDAGSEFGRGIRGYRDCQVFLRGRGNRSPYGASSLRLSPRDTLVYIWNMFVGLSKLWQGADAEGIVWLRRSLEADRNYPGAHFNLAAALALVGQLDEARSTAQAGLALNPDLRPSADIASTRQAIIRCITRDASASLRPFGWPGCLKDSLRRRQLVKSGHCARSAACLLYP